jgi:hypothetical protein
VGVSIGVALGGAGVAVAVGAGVSLGGARVALGANVAVDSAARLPLIEHAERARDNAPMNNALMNNDQ